MWIDQLLKLNLVKNNHFKDELQLVHTGECNWFLGGRGRGGGGGVNSQHTLKRISCAHQMEYALVIEKLICKQIKM